MYSREWMYLHLYEMSPGSRGEHVDRSATVSEDPKTMMYLTIPVLGGMMF